MLSLTRWSLCIPFSVRWAYPNKHTDHVQDRLWAFQYWVRIHRPIPHKTVEHTRNLQISDQRQPFDVKRRGSLCLFPRRTVRKMTLDWTILILIWWDCRYRSNTHPPSPLELGVESSKPRGFSRQLASKCRPRKVDKMRVCCQWKSVMRQWCRACRCWRV